MVGERGGSAPGLLLPLPAGMFVLPRRISRRPGSCPGACLGPLSGDPGMFFEEYVVRWRMFFSKVCSTDTGVPRGRLKPLPPKD